jgi:hypothetical protein
MGDGQVIEQFPPRFLPRQGDNPPMVVNERAYLKCGCTVAVGIRTDSHEAAAGAMPCSPDHFPLMNMFLLLLKESLINPQPVPLVGVCDELLKTAERMHRKNEAERSE